MAVALSYSGLPQTFKGDPVSGKFAFGGLHDGASTYTYYVGEYDPGTELYNAAHADLGSESAWAEGEPFIGKNWATYFRCVLPESQDLIYLFLVQLAAAWEAADINAVMARYADDGCWNSLNKDEVRAFYQSPERFGRGLGVHTWDCDIAVSECEETGGSVDHGEEFRVGSLLFNVWQLFLNSDSCY